MKFVPDFLKLYATLNTFQVYPAFPLDSFANLFHVRKNNFLVQAAVTYEYVSFHL